MLTGGAGAVAVKPLAPSLLVHLRELSPQVPTRDTLPWVALERWERGGTGRVLAVRPTIAAPTPCLERPVPAANAGDPQAGGDDRPPAMGGAAANPAVADAADDSILHIALRHASEPRIA